IALLARIVRRMAERRRHLVRLSYPGGRTTSIAPGTTILDASRAARIPHASVCGGRGRRSACRVRILDGNDSLPEPSAEEARVLERIGAPPNVRLACQTRPVSDATVMPLLPSTANAREGFARPAYL